MRADEFLVAKYLEMEAELKKEKEKAQYASRLCDRKDDAIRKLREEKKLWSELARFAKFDGARLYIYIPSYENGELIERLCNLIGIEETNGDNT